ncbi:MAG TPA: carbon-nitrogen hydrolase family protein [Chloroflexi bacterium]|nr:carbon-nitrogen hydrolase family protein [Chloroflexota bacterium]
MQQAQGLVRVAVIQHPPVFLNVEESLKQARRFVIEAAEQGAAIVVFPETWLPGYPVWLDFSPRAALWDYAPAKALYQALVENALTIPGPRLAALLDLARETGVYLVVGAHELAGGTLYNTIVYVDRGGKDFRIHRKLMPTYTERMLWGRGDGSTLSVLDTAWGVLGGLICWEHWMPLARAAMHARGETIHVAQWPAVKDLHHLASRHYAFEGQCFVIAAGCILTRGEAISGFKSLGKPNDAGLELLEAMPGDDADLILRGGSAVIGPDTEYVLEPVIGRAAVIYADLHLEQIAQGHLTMDTQGHYARPDVFHLEVDDRPQVNVTFKNGVGK